VIEPFQPTILASRGVLALYPRSSILDTPIAIYLNRSNYVKENSAVPQSIQLSGGTNGGPETFAGQATQMLRRLYPVLGEPSYFPDAPSLFSALDTGAVDTIIGAAASLGADHTSISDRLTERVRRHSRSPRPPIALQLLDHDQGRRAGG
jgi:hypothetical protein